LEIYHVEQTVRSLIPGLYNKKFLFKTIVLSSPFNVFT
jgi:hypothetical protein